MFLAYHYAIAAQITQVKHKIRRHPSNLVTQ